MKATAENSPPYVSVIMITRDRHELAERAIASVQACGYPRDRIQFIVVEETATPSAFAGVDVYDAIPVKNLGFGYARNRGVSFALQPLIVFVDDDCVVEPGWLKELVLPLQSDETVAAVAGAVLLPDGSGPVGQCESILGFPGGGVKYVYDAGGVWISCASFSTCNCAVRRSAMDEVGAFSEGLRYGGEDENLSRRIGAKFRMVFNPGAVVRHAPRGTFSANFNWFVRRGKARLSMLRQGRASAREWTALVMTSQSVRLSLALVTVLVLDLPLLPCMAALAGAYYLSVLVRIGWSLKYYPYAGTLLLVPIVKMVMDLGMDVGHLAYFFAGRDHQCSRGVTTCVGFLSNHADIVGGGEISFIDLVLAVKTLGVEPVVFVPGEGEVCARLKEKGIRCVYFAWPPVSPLHLLRFIGLQRELAERFKDENLGLVHVNGARCMLYAGPAARRAAIPCVWHVRVTERDGWLDKIRARYSSAIIANSIAVAATIRSLGVSADRIEVIYNGFNQEAIEGQPRLDPGVELGVKVRPIILAAGRFSPWKRFEDLLTAAAIMQERGMRFSVILAGRSLPEEKAYEDMLRSMVKTLGLTDSVCFAGWRDDIPSLMKAADVFVLPSDCEPFGRVVVEAWLCGLPVVATCAGGPAELITHDRNGLLYEPCNVQALATCLTSLLSDRGQRERLAHQALLDARQFSIENHVKQVRDLYQRLVLTGNNP